MKEVYKYFLAIIMLISAIPIGNFLSKITKEELKSGNKWFKILIISALILSVLFLFKREDDLFFCMLFIAIVTSRSLNFKKSKKNK